MAKNEKTSKRVATIASELLRNPTTPAKAKKVSGSAMTQAPDKPKPRGKK